MVNKEFQCRYKTG